MIIFHVFVNVQNATNRDLLTPENNVRKIRPQNEQIKMETTLNIKQKYSVSNINTTNKKAIVLFLVEIISFNIIYFVLTTY